jgi:hypothetical protein
MIVSPDARIERVAHRAALLRWIGMRMQRCVVRDFSFADRVFGMSKLTQNACTTASGLHLSRAERRVCGEIGGNAKQSVVLPVDLGGRGA